MRLFARSSRPRRDVPWGGQGAGVPTPHLPPNSTVNPEPATLTVSPPPPLSSPNLQPPLWLLLDGLLRRRYYIHAEHLLSRWVSAFADWLETSWGNRDVIPVRLLRTCDLRLRNTLAVLSQSGNIHCNYIFIIFSFFGNFLNYMNMFFEILFLIFK